MKFKINLAPYNKSIVQNELQYGKYNFEKLVKLLKSNKHRADIIEKSKEKQNLPFLKNLSNFPFRPLANKLTKDAGLAKSSSTKLRPGALSAKLLSKLVVEQCKGDFCDYTVSETNQLNIKKIYFKPIFILLNFELV